MADDNKVTSAPGMSQGDRHEIMKNMGNEERQAMREERSGKGGKSQ